DAAGAVETEVAAAVGKAVEERKERFDIRLSRRPQPQRSSVTEDHVHRACERGSTLALRLERGAHDREASGASVARLRLRAAPAGIASTGHGDVCSSRCVTLPTKNPIAGPYPRVPTTITSASTSRATSAMASAVWEVEPVRNLVVTSSPSSRASSAWRRILLSSSPSSPRSGSPELRPPTNRSPE